MSYNPTSCPAQLRQHRCKKRIRAHPCATERNNRIDHAIVRACHATSCKNVQHHATHSSISIAEGEIPRGKAKPGRAEDASGCPCSSPWQSDLRTPSQIADCAQRSRPTGRYPEGARSIDMKRRILTTVMLADRARVPRPYAAISASIGTPRSTGQRCAYRAPATHGVGHFANGLGALLFALNDLRAALV